MVMFTLTAVRGHVPHAPLRRRSVGIGWVKYLTNLRPGTAPSRAVSDFLFVADRGGRLRFACSISPFKAFYFRVGVLVPPKAFRRRLTG